MQHAKRLWSHPRNEETLEGYNICAHYLGTSFLVLDQAVRILDLALEAAHPSDHYECSSTVHRTQ